MKYYFYGTIKNNKLELDDKEWFKSIINLMGVKNGDKIVMTLDKARKQRTSGKKHEISNQLGYYWVVIIPILSEHFGYTPEEMHEALKIKFMRVGGTDSLPRIKSTTNLNTKEWEDLMEKIRIWALSEYEIVIPEPNENI